MKEAHEAGNLSQDHIVEYVAAFTEIKKIWDEQKAAGIVPEEVYEGFIKEFDINRTNKSSEEVAKIRERGEELFTELYSLCIEMNEATPALADPAMVEPF